LITHGATGDSRTRDVGTPAAAVTSFAKRSGTEHRDARVPERVGQAGDERHLGADDDEIGSERPRESEHRLAVVRPDGMTRAQRRDPRIPRCRMQLVEHRALSELPGERVLTPAGAD
jgi:hypothetical protein